MTQAPAGLQPPRAPGHAGIWWSRPFRGRGSSPAQPRGSWRTRTRGASAFQGDPRLHRPKCGVGVTSQGCRRWRRNRKRPLCPQEQLHLTSPHPLRGHECNCRLVLAPARKVTTCSPSSCILMLHCNCCISREADVWSRRL